jgi:hypothetical protein
VDGSRWAQAAEGVRHRVLEKHRFQQQQQQQQQQQGMLPETRSTPLPPRVVSSSPMGRPPPAAMMRPDLMSAAGTTAAMAAASGTAAGNAYAVYGAAGVGSTAGRAGVTAMLADQPLRRHNSAPITTGEVVVSRQPSAAVQSVTTHGPTL